MQKHKGNCKMNGNVLVLTNFMAGLYSFRKEVMKAIVDDGYQLYISVPDAEDELAKRIEEIGCHLIKTEFNRRGMNPLSDFKLMMAYRRIIKQLKPIAVLSYTIKPNVYGGIACRLTGTPLIANVTGLGDAIENGGFLQKLTMFLYRLGIGKADQVFFQNEADKSFCVKHKIADNNAIVLPGSGVNLVYHTMQEYPKEGCTIFLYIARLQRDKGVEEFFEAAKTIKKKYSEDVVFQVLGWKKGDYEQEMDELDKNGVVKYLGKTSDVRPYLKEVHCTIMPSYHEGMSNVNLESAANGRPVITTNVSGCRETVDDGKTGYLVESKSTEALINGIERFLEVPYNQKRFMGQMAREKVEREFDRNIVVKAYLKVIESLS